MLSLSFLSTELCVVIVVLFALLVPEPSVVFSDSLPFHSLYSGTVFNLTCEVVLVSEVDTPVTVLTSWSRDGTDIDDGNGRISTDSEAAKTSSSMNSYKSSVVFDPLSNTETGGDSGNYMCQVDIRESGFVSGTTASNSHTLTVQG